MPRASQTCPHSPEMAPPAGQGQPAGFWAVTSPSCCLGLPVPLNSSPTPSSFPLPPACPTQAQLQSHQGCRELGAILGACCSSGRQAASETLAPSVCTLLVSPLMIRRRPATVLTSEPPQAYARVLMAAVVALKWDVATDSLYFGLCRRSLHSCCHLRGPFPSVWGLSPHPPCRITPFAGRSAIIPSSYIQGWASAEALFAFWVFFVCLSISERKGKGASERAIRENH